MKYSELYFGKSLSALTYDDIVNFFKEEKIESNKMEFKSFHSNDENSFQEKENSVLRTICGLLNSEGGIIIWGAPEGKNVPGKTEKIFVGPLSPCDKLIEKDRFVSRITDSITPAPRGIEFQRLESNSEYIYIIEVTQSSFSPHQFRNVYYMRIDGQTKPAPHHYIEALFKKITYPRLEGYIKIDSFKRELNQYILSFSYYVFNKTKLQNEHELYLRIIVTAGSIIGWNLPSNSSNKTYASSGHELLYQNAKPTLYFNEPLMDSLRVSINPEKLKRLNFECQIMLFFGGKLSPLRVSEYHLLLKDPDLEDTNKYFIKIDENIYQFEYSERLNVTDSDTLKQILGR
jgi:hypothetical protein